MNLSGVSSAVLGFYYSYSTQTTDLDNVTEKLEVFSSTDCGRSWQLRTSIATDDLVTNGATPGPGNWVARNVILPQSVLSNNVRFRFRFTSSDFSGDLYLDDINVGLAVGLDEMAGESLLNIFPNPSNDIFNIQVTGMDRLPTQVTIQDLRGSVVYDNQVAPQGGVGIEVSSRALGLAEGMYVVRTNNELGTSAQKIIVGR
jgi:hypothetical protein